MDPHSASQLDKMPPGMLIIMLVWLGAFMLTAKLVNVIARRPLVNGAAIFCCLVFAPLVALSLYAVFCSRNQHLAEMMGGCAFDCAPALIASFFFARSSERKKKAASNNALA